jgi:hypothetical protein
MEIFAVPRGAVSTNSVSSMTWGYEKYQIPKNTKYKGSVTAGKPQGKGAGEA